MCVYVCVCVCVLHSMYYNINCTTICRISIILLEDIIALYVKF